jgi:hypothetical protein
LDFELLYKMKVVPLAFILYLPKVEKILTSGM